MDPTSSSMDECIKATFDMLVERISNLEEGMAQQRRAAVFAECCKYGQLNNEALGYPFEIIRAPQFPQAPCETSMQVLFVKIEGDCHDDCGICDDGRRLIGPFLGEGVTLDNYYDRWFKLTDQHPRAFGWNESRFEDAQEEAVQRYIDTLFENSQFECTLLKFERLDYVTAIVALSHKSRRSIRLDKFLAQIPRLHTNANEHEIEISTACSDQLSLVMEIQNAANLPDGPLKEIAKRKRDGHPREFVEKLADETRWVAIDAVYGYLNWKGCVTVKSFILLSNC